MKDSSPFGLRFHHALLTLPPDCLHPAQLDRVSGGSGCHYRGNSDMWTPPPPIPQAVKKGASQTVVGLIFGCYAICNLIGSLVLGRYVSSAAPVPVRHAVQ